MIRKHRFLLKMAGKSKKLGIAKYLFFTLLILCLFVVSSLLYLSDTSIPQNDNLGDVKYAKLVSPEFLEDILDSNFEACFFTNTSNFTHPSSSVSSYEKKIYTYNRKVKSEDLINVFIQFADLSHQLGIETFLIEPSLLFCILSPTLKDLLLRRNFMEGNRSSEHVLTMGIYQKDAAILEKEDVQYQLEKMGFQIKSVDLPILNWMKSVTYLNRSVFTSNVFLEKDKWILHLVVFHERKTFLWHSALLTQADSITSEEDSFLFVDADAAFENFTAVSLGLKLPSLKNVNIPSNAANFLHQIATSRFLDCNETIINLFRKLPTSNLATHHEYSSLTREEFNQRLLITIEELKLKLDPLLISFWVWSGTLLGLHRQCAVIPYTSDADFATWEIDAHDIDILLKGFVQNEHLTIKEKLGRVEEGLELKFHCHGLKVDLFFVYEQENGTWYAGHSPKSGYYFKYHHPTFSLCSAELLGQKVNIPCETENVISTEYGSNWMQPVSSWSYDHSVYNRGPNIYWTKKLSEVYRFF